MRKREGELSTRLPSAQVFLASGIAFALVGAIDIGLLWFPLRFGNVAWEYATVGRSLDSIPMPALGLVLVAFGALRHPKVTGPRLRLVSGGFILLGLCMTTLALLLLTSAPAVLSQTPPEAMQAAGRAAARHTLQAIVYPLAWFTVAGALWKAGRSGNPG